MPTSLAGPPPVRTDVSETGLRAAIQADLERTSLRGLPLAGTEVIDTPELALRRSAVPVQDANVVFRTRLAGDDATVDARLDGIVASYRANDLPFRWWIGTEDRPADLQTRLTARGLTVSRTGIPGMALDLERLVPEVPASPVAVQPVDEPAALEAYLALVGQMADETGGRGRSRVRAAMEAAVRERVRRDGYTERGVPVRWLGLLGDRPVGTGRLSFAAGVAGVYGIGTVSEARRQGVARAVLGTMLGEARTAGLRIAVLQSSEEAVPLYRSVGFRTLLAWTVMGWEPTGG